MSYTGYVKMFSSFCEGLKNASLPRPVQILEIGVDRGQTALPLLHNLISRDVDFVFYGVDIREDETFLNQIDKMDGVVYDRADKKCNYFYCIANSLDFLPKIKQDSEGAAFDLILVDGDHNYQTVFAELSHINSLSHKYSLIALDDYSKKYARKDQFYSDHPGYENLPHKDLDKNSSKQGVMTAVEDFISQNPQWRITDLEHEDEVCFLTQNIFLEHDKENNIYNIIVSEDE